MNLIEYNKKWTKVIELNLWNFFKIKIIKMPENAEIYIITKQMDEYLSGFYIKKIKQYINKNIDDCIIGEKLLKVDSKGKVIIFYFENLI